MSRDADVTLVWGDGEYRFQLPIKGLEEIQERCGDVGPPVIHNALLTQTWKVSYIREPIRVGLIHGSKLKPAEAFKLVQRYVDERPLMENVPYAASIIGAALYGVETEQLKKSGEAAETADSPPYQGGNSDSLRSMDAES